MTAYVISEVEVLDEARGQKFRELAAASIPIYGGRYAVRGVEPEVPEGEWPSAQRVVIVEFPTMEQLHRWYGSPEYAEALSTTDRTQSKAALRRWRLRRNVSTWRRRSRQGKRCLVQHHEGLASPPLR
jgi:uncharacterized protein (DUF1330 family)